MARPLLLPFSFLLINGACLAQAVPNGGFETWADVGGFDDPDQWSSYNSMTFPIASVLVCEEGTPGAVGASYVKLTTKAAGGAGTVPGTIYSTADLTGPSGFPHSQHSATLTGKWKYDVQASDQAMITVAMSKWNSTTNQRDAIGFGASTATGSLANWTTFSIPINYVGAENPDTALIYVMSSASAGVVGSTISVDDLAFGAATGVEEQTIANTFEISPVSANEFVRVDAGKRMATVTIVDMNGRTVQSANATGQPIMLDVSGFASGVYRVRVQFGDGSTGVRPFVKG